jgi:hypothetical protein
MNQKLLYFLTRIDSLTPIHKSKYCKMNVNQMVCHCTDFYHTALKEISLIDAPKILKEKVLILVKEQKIVPTPKDINKLAGKSKNTNNTGLIFIGIGANSPQIYFNSFSVGHCLLFVNKIHQLFINLYTKTISKCRFRVF